MTPRDRAQIQELLINCELAELGREMGCQMLVEGPGHVPLDEIEGNIQLQKRMSGGAPYYMLGPIATDVAPGFDHITAAIGAAQSSRFGADLICYITPAEHLALPNEEDVRLGVKAAKIAAYIGDMNKYPEKGAGAGQGDVQGPPRPGLGETVRAGPLPGGRPRHPRQPDPEDEATCTMCGDFCASRGAGKLFADDLKHDKI